VAPRYHVQQTEWNALLVDVVRVVERHSLPTVKASESYSWQDVTVMDVQMIWKVISPFVRCSKIKSHNNELALT
jgi:hypothetical protein